MSGTKTSREMASAAESMRDAVGRMEFPSPVEYVYNPLEYAWQAHQAYLDQYARGPKRVLFLGMNPGPWGMAQTGVPFGEVAAVRDWLGIETKVSRPAREHPKRPIQGFECVRSEVSGRRVWGLFAARFGTADVFFREHFVANYCPLVFMDSGGRNLTPDKLAASQARALEQSCDEHLASTLNVLKPQVLVGIGQYAEECLRRVAGREFGRAAQIVRILHPSPASPAANRGWATAVEKVLVETGVWSEK
jgi:single-strand selective monofunctional uracil DNA glycosylase